MIKVSTNGEQSHVVTEEGLKAAGIDVAPPYRPHDDLKAVLAVAEAHPHQADPEAIKRLRDHYELA